MDAWACSCLPGCSVGAESFPYHMVPSHHLPDLGNEEALLDFDPVVALCEPAYPDYYLPAGFDGDWG